MKNNNFKEPSLIKKAILSNKVVKNQKNILTITIICMVALILSSSYAILNNFSKIDDVITFKTGNLELSILNGEEAFTLINSSNRLPESDETGVVNATVIPITLKNTGTLAISGYEVKLISDTNSLSDEYIRYTISEDNVTYIDPSSLTISNNIVYSGTNLGIGATKTIYLKIWVAESAGEVAFDKTYNGSLEVELYQKFTPVNNLLDVVKAKYGTDGLIAVNTDGSLYTGSGTIREYRYSGASVNNYVYFDTNGDGEKTDNEIWRIIGIFEENGEEYLKLVRNTIFAADELPSTYTINGTSFTILNSDNSVNWNSTLTATNKNDWTTSGLQYFLNTESDTSGTTGYLGSFTENTRNLLRNTTYYLGNVNYETNTPKTAYTNERGSVICDSSVTSYTDDNNCNVWYGNPISWTGKVALLYPSDYGYSVGFRYWDVTMGYDVYQKTGFNVAQFDNGIPSNTTWMELTLNHSANEWLLSPAIAYPYWGTVWYSLKALTNQNVSSTGYHARPVISLKSDTKWVSGNGKENSPYVVWGNQ